MNNPHSYTEGFLYSDKQTLEYKPEKLLQHNKVVPAHRLSYKQTMMNDCLPFAVNQLVRHEFFCSREQVQRLWQSSVHWSQLRVDEKKVQFGVSIKAFKEFFVKDGLAYSFVKVCQFEGSEPYKHLKTFVEQNLLWTATYGQILVLGIF